MKKFLFRLRIKYTIYDLILCYIFGTIAKYTLPKGILSYMYRALFLNIWKFSPEVILGGAAVDFINFGALLAFCIAIYYLILIWTKKDITKLFEVKIDNDAK